MHISEMICVYYNQCIPANFATNMCHINNVANGMKKKCRRAKLIEILESESKFCIQIWKKILIQRIFATFSSIKFVYLLSYSRYLVRSVQITMLGMTKFQGNKYFHKIAWIEV